MEEINTEELDGLKRRLEIKEEIFPWSDLVRLIDREENFLKAVPRSVPWVYVARKRPEKTGIDLYLPEGLRLYGLKGRRELGFTLDELNYLIPGSTWKPWVDTEAVFLAATGGGPHPNAFVRGNLDMGVSNEGAVFAVQYYKILERLKSKG